ncbi:heparan-alpha-glucosaminide N-acetyltransferase isoform X1 [Tachysurus ichikawai]
MGTEGKKHNSGLLEKQEGVTVDDMGAKSQHGPVIVALIAVIFAVSGIRSELVLSRPSRKSPVLKMDEAFLTVLNEIQSDVILSVLSGLCYQCFPQPVGIVPSVSGPGNVSALIFTVNTQHALTLQLNSTPANNELCRVNYHFGEQGNYSLWVKNLNNPNDFNCTIVTITGPINSSLRKIQNCYSSDTSYSTSDTSYSTSDTPYIRHAVHQTAALINQTVYIQLFY